MPATITCVHCGNTVPRNPRIKKKQKYCSADECQKARCRAWKKKSYHENKAYRKRCLAQQKKWRQKCPADKYQSVYREDHPEYVHRNRELQRQRNKSRKEATAEEIIINENALLFQPGEGGIWFLSKACGEMIVNRNALSVQPTGGSTYALLALEEPKIVNRNALMTAGP